MIKGDYFLKLLRPLFSILLIGFFGLLGNSFVKADYSSELPYNFYIDSNFETIYKDLNFQSDSGNWLYKEYNANIVRSFFWNNGKLYTYFYENASSNYQGYFDKVCKFYDEDGILESDGFCTNGGDYSTENLVEFYNLQDYNFTRAISPAYAGFNYYAPVLCFYNENNNYYYCFNLENHNGGSLNILGLVKDFTSYAGNSPFGYGQGGTQGSVEVNPDSTYTGDYTYTECTNGSIMNYAEKMGLTPLLCQGGLDNWDLLTATGIYNPIPGTGKWLDEIYGYTTNSGQLNAKEWFNYRNTAYINQYVSNQNIWYSQPAVLRSYFKFYNEYGGNNFDFETVYEYCLMRKFYTRDNSYATHKYQGQYFKKTCTFLDNGGWDGYNSGENINGLNWGLSGAKTYNDPGQFITDMFTKIKSYIPTDKSDIGLGFLPTYIITFMLFLILFRFLSH